MLVEKIQKNINFLYMSVWKNLKNDNFLRFLKYNLRVCKMQAVCGMAYSLQQNTALVCLRKILIFPQTYMYKFFLTLVFFIMGFFAPTMAQDDFYKIYEELKQPDFEYIFGIDPYQAEDYTKYMFSPYPLFRLGVNFIFKDTIIPPGFYLLTPRKYNGESYILFKEQGRVKYIIPVYNVDMTTEESYDQYIPKAKLSKWKKFKTKVADTVGTMFPEKTQRMPMPQSYMEINDIDGEFWQIVLYYGNQKYYLIFKQDIK